MTQVLAWRKRDVLNGMLVLLYSFYLPISSRETGHGATTCENLMICFQCGESGRETAQDSKC